jgi:hypothetical protein
MTFETPLINLAVVASATVPAEAMKKVSESLDFRRLVAADLDLPISIYQSRSGQKLKYEF